MKHSFPEPERYARQNFPEAIYTPGKAPQQIIGIARALLKGSGPVIATRAERSLFLKIKNKFPNSVYYSHAGIILFNKNMRVLAEKQTSNYICVVTAGTTDIPIAEEAAVTAEILGNKVNRIYDVGVSGMHRLIKYRELLEGAACAVVCAGMEGALASVVGGLVGCPVIGVPTSVGYGAAFKGVSALLSMLNSCAPNVSAVNIDDGFGAGIIASLINKPGKSPK